MAIHLPMDNAQLRPLGVDQDGSACNDVAPGLVTILDSVEGADAPNVVSVWADPGETTVLDIGTLTVSATATETEDLARIVLLGRCTRASISSSCSSDESTESLEGLRAALSSTALRNRQAARLTLLARSHDDWQTLAAPAWDDLEETPLIAAAYPDVVAALALAMGPDAAVSLETAASEGSGAARKWSAQVRGTILMHLMERAEADVQVRIRQVILDDQELRDSYSGQRVLALYPMSSAHSIQAYALAREVVGSLAAEPCATDSHWILYVHSLACPACKPAVAYLTTLLEADRSPLHIVTVSADGAETRLAESPSVYAVDISPAMQGWFDDALGGVMTPYFFVMECHDGQLVFEQAGTLKEIRTIFDGRASAG